MAAVLSVGRRAPPGAWLGPSLGDEVRSAAADGVRAVLVAPFGFVADHVEILYDIDVELRELGESLGVAVSRTRSLGSDPELIEVLADRVLDAAAAHGADRAGLAVAGAARRMLKAGAGARSWGRDAHGTPGGHQSRSGARRAACPP